ncbi:MAG TPA: hypothetical protein VER11_11495 [Polyangiaceae bacterium]|nr:hypothetical protein [Polyangiaceae bacterium]
MAALVVFAALVFWAGVFAIFFTSQETTLPEFLFGRYEPLPHDLNQWSAAAIDDQSGLLREQRFVLPAGRSDGPYLLRQVRYRDPATGKIVRACPEERVRRGRISVRSR